MTDSITVISLDDYTVPTLPSKMTEFSVEGDSEPVRGGWDEQLVSDWLTGVADGELQFLILVGDDGSYLQSAPVTSGDGRLVIEWGHPEGAEVRLFGLYRTRPGSEPRLAPSAPGYRGNHPAEAFSLEEALVQFRSYFLKGMPEKVFLEDKEL